MQNSIEQIPITSLHEGQLIDLGSTSLTEQEIIDFATVFDPLDFHIDREAAANSHFGELVASGPQIFTVVHRNQWIPRFGKSVLAGLEVSNWKFLGPTKANTPIRASVEITKHRPNAARGHVVITWLYRFWQADGAPVQQLEMTILHKLPA